MTERDSGMNSPVTNKNSLSKYIGPAIILAFATTIFYFFGMIYSATYFDRFSFPYQNLNLPPSIYIIPLIATLLINLYSIIIMYEINNRKFETNTDITLNNKLFKTLNKLLYRYRSLNRNFPISILLFISIGFEQLNAFKYLYRILYVGQELPTLLVYVLVYEWITVLIVFTLIYFTINRLCIEDINIINIVQFLAKTLYGFKMNLKPWVKLNASIGISLILFIFNIIIITIAGFNA